MLQTLKLRWFVVALFVIALIMRFVPHAYNVAGFAALALFAGCYLNIWQGMVIAFGAVALSDVIGQWWQLPGMGFYTKETMFAVYLATALPSVIGWALKKADWRITAGAGSILSAIVFFVVTNFAAWLDPIMKYPQTAEGLINCYVAAVPFIGGTLVGTFLYAYAFFASYRWLSRYEHAREGRSSTNSRTC